MFMHIRTYIHACMHAYMHIYIRTCIHTCIHACACIYMYICMYAYVYICLYTYILICINTGPRRGLQHWHVCIHGPHEKSGISELAGLSVCYLATGSPERNPQYMYAFMGVYVYIYIDVCIFLDLHSYQKPGSFCETFYTNTLQSMVGQLHVVGDAGFLLSAIVLYCRL